MTDLELSDYIRKNHKANANSLRGRKPLYGKAINDADYVVRPKIAGKFIMCPAYAAWSRMIARCYSVKCKEKQPTYCDVSTSNEWLSFMAFRKWWVDNNVTGWQLDKDLLSVGNRTYSEETCIFVPQWLNLFLCDSNAKRGKYPIGVSEDKENQLYRACCNNPMTNKTVKIGRYKTVAESSSAYVKYKLGIADKLKVEMDKIDTRIYRNAILVIGGRYA